MCFSHTPRWLLHRQVSLVVLGIPTWGKNFFKFKKSGRESINNTKIFIAHLKNPVENLWMIHMSGFFFQKHKKITHYSCLSIPFTVRSDVPIIQISRFGFLFSFYFFLDMYVCMSVRVCVSTTTKKNRLYMYSRFFGLERSKFVFCSSYRRRLDMTSIRHQIDVRHIFFYFFIFFLLS